VRRSAVADFRRLSLRRPTACVKGKKVHLLLTQTPAAPGSDGTVPFARCDVIYALEVFCPLSDCEQLVHEALS